MTHISEPAESRSNSVSLYQLHNFGWNKRSPARPIVTWLKPTTQYPHAETSAHFQFQPVSISGSPAPRNEFSFGSRKGANTHIHIGRESGRTGGRRYPRRLVCLKASNNALKPPVIFAAVLRPQFPPHTHGKRENCRGCCVQAMAQLRLGVFYASEYQFSAYLPANGTFPYAWTRAAQHSSQARSAQRMK